MPQRRPGKLLDDPEDPIAEDLGKIPEFCIIDTQRRDAPTTQAACVDQSERVQALGGSPSSAPPPVSECSYGMENEASAISLPASDQRENGRFLGKVGSANPKIDIYRLPGSFITSAIQVTVMSGSISWNAPMVVARTIPLSTALSSAQSASSIVVGSHATTLYKIDASIIS
jgi:hypothetical protein